MVKEIIFFLFSLIKFLSGLKTSKPKEIKQPDDNTKEPVEELTKKEDNTSSEIKLETYVNPELFDKSKSTKELLELLIEGEQDDRMKDILERMRSTMDR